MGENERLGCRWLTEVGDVPVFHVDLGGIPLARQKLQVGWTQPKRNAGPGSVLARRIGSSPCVVPHCDLVSARYSAVRMTDLLSDSLATASRLRWWREVVHRFTSTWPTVARMG